MRLFALGVIMTLSHGIAHGQHHGHHGNRKTSKGT